ncbi:hypothetical protein [Streptomyces cinereoruber]|uniref:hypothetical protein n=1 Tax=Streptomyces cinereoruber TaxID=67260 RepID=UPI00362EC7AD
MGEASKRRPVLRSLAVAASCLVALAVLSWFLSEAVGADHPRRPVWDVGSAGPWAASYARAIAAGSWTAACVCLMLAALLVVLDFVSLLVAAIRRGARRLDRPAS